MSGNDYLDNGSDDHCRAAHHDHHDYHHGHTVQKSNYPFCGSDLQNQIGFSGIPYIAPIVTVSE
jgi:hypothetical protein